MNLQRLRSIHWNARAIRVIIAVLAVILAASAVAKGAALPMAQKSPSARRARATHMVVYADYAEAFDTVQAMATASDLVAEGVVVSNTYLPDAVPAPSTDYVFEISRVLANRKGDHVPTRIVMHELGGPQLPESIVIKNALPYHNGDHLIVFLSEVAPGKYTSVAGPPSAFDVHGDTVTAHTPAQHVASFTSPVPLTAFIATVSH